MPVSEEQVGVLYADIQSVKLPKKKCYSFALTQQKKMRTADARGRYFLQYLSVILIVLCFSVYTVAQKNIDEHMRLSGTNRNPLSWLPVAQVFQERDQLPTIWSTQVKFTQLQAKAFVQTEQFHALRKLFRSHDLSIELHVAVSTGRIQESQTAKQLARFVSRVRRAFLNSHIPSADFVVSVDLIKPGEEELLTIRVYEAPVADTHSLERP
jgi:hypothetical protein